MYSILQVITVFSAPNYCDRHGNKGAVCVLHGDDISMPEFRKFDAMPHPKVRCIYDNISFSVRLKFQITIIDCEGWGYKYI